MVAGLCFPWNISFFSKSLLSITCFLQHSQFLSNFERAFHLLPAELPSGQTSKWCYFSFLKNLQRCRVTFELELWAFKRLCSEPSVKGEERGQQLMFRDFMRQPNQDQVLKWESTQGAVFKGKVNMQLATGVESSEWCRILWTSWWIGCKSEGKELKNSA